MNRAGGFGKWIDGITIENSKFFRFKSIYIRKSGNKYQEIMFEVYSFAIEINFCNSIQRLKTN